MTAPGSAEEPLEIGVTSFGTGGCSPSMPGYYVRADAIEPWVAAEIAANPPLPAAPPAPPVPPGVDLTPREPRPTVTFGKALAEATAALRRGLGTRFAGRRRYEIACKEVNLHKRQCRVSWRSGTTRYRGTVTVIGLFVAGKAVWHAPYAVHATTCTGRDARGKATCREQTFHGG